MGVTGTIPSTVAPSSKSWLGVGRELIPGLGPVLPTNTIPLEMSSYQPEDTPKFLHDEAIRGVMASLYNDILGVEDATFSFGGPMFMDVGGFWIDNTFGDLSTTGSTPTSSTTTTTVGSVGATTVTLTSGSGYSSSSIVQLGTGSIAEVVVLTAVAGGTITFTNNPLRFTHGTPSAASIVAAPFTHKWAILNSGSGQPPTQTLTDYTSLTASVGARAYPSACVSQLDFTGNSEQLLMQKVSGNSWLSIPAVSTPTNTTAFTIPQPNWLSTVSIGGTPAYNIGEWTVSVKRMLQVYWTAQNAQTPYIIARGGLNISGGLNFTVASSESPLTQMLAGAPLAISIALSNGLSGASLLSMTITTTASVFEKSKPTRNAVLIGYDNTYECVANTTDVGGSGGIGPGTITLTNSIPTY